VTAGATLTFDAGNYDVPQTVTLTAADDPDADEDKALIFVTADDYIPAIIHATEVEDDLLP
jgi:hypothetical protein